MYQEGLIKADKYLQKKRFCTTNNDLSHDKWKPEIFSYICESHFVPNK